jgi:hypothetical protein
VLFVCLEGDCSVDDPLSKMAEKQEDGAPNKDAAKKKKTKPRGASRSRKESSGTGKGPSTRQDRENVVTEAVAVEEQRKRSRSADKKSRRDSGSLRNSGIGGSGRQAEGGEKSPQRARKPKSTVHHKAPIPKGDRTANPLSLKERGRSRSPSAKERGRSRSPTTATMEHQSSTTGQTSGAPRLPQRTSSESSSLLQAALSKGKSPDRKKDNYEEASLGDFQKYSAKQEQKLQRFGASMKMGEIPEESLGSFTAFHRKYEQEELLGLHDDDEAASPYGPKSSESKQQAAEHEQSASLGAIMNPIKQYGGVTGGKPKSAAIEESLGRISALKQYGGGGGVKAKNTAVEDSLGSFTAFHKKYEHEELLGINGSAAESALFTESAALKKKKEPAVPEESMGDFVQMASNNATPADGDNEQSKQKARKGEEKNFDPACIPSSRIKNLGKRGGVGYKIMVDTPGGHSEPMRIVVAIEFDETDSDGSGDDDYENADPVEPADNAADSESCASSDTHWRRQTKTKSDIQTDETTGSGHLPISPLHDDAAAKDTVKVPRRKKKHPRATPENAAEAKQQKPIAQDEGNDEDSDSDDEIGPLASNMNRWNNQAISTGGTLKQPERERSTHSHSTNSTHSTVSSVTLDTALESGALIIQTDACPSNANVLQRQPTGRARSLISTDNLRRPSGAMKMGGTATLLAPHNLGTRRGLMLRQQSEASMKSTGTSKSNDSSWQGNNNDTPADYEASFMQLNLLDLDKTQIQTNETVQQTQLPDELLSGIEGIDKSFAKQTEGLEPIPEGKDPQAAASELLGMKTMLKHIKRVAPKRSISFEFDRDMPKQMWNKMFAKSQKGALPGSQYVDNDDSTGHDEDDKIESAREEEVPKSDSQRAPGGRSTDDKVAEKNGSKSLWSSVMKRVIPLTSTDVAPGEAAPDEAGPDETHQLEPDGEGMDVSERSLELGAILQELDQSLAYGLDLGVDPEETDGPAGQRRRATEKANDGSGRGPRSGHSRIANEIPKKGGIARSRVNRNSQVHHRSLRDTLDYLSAEHEDDELPQLDAIKEEDAKKKARVRARRKPPMRTRSDESAARKEPSRAKSSDGTRPLGRTRSHDGSPVRASKRTTERMHSSFSGVDPGNLPIRSKASKDGTPRTKSVREGPSNPGRSGRADKGPRGSVIRKHRPLRKKSTSGAGAEEADSSGHVRGVQIPVNATENEVRELLDYH